MTRCRFSSALIAFILLLFAGCRQTVIVAQEQDSPSTDDTGSETDVNTDSATVADSETEVVCDLPASFTWTTSDVLIERPAGIENVKDPTIVFANERWYFYATTFANSDFSMISGQFSSLATAGAAIYSPVTENVNFAGYAAAPQLFYFAPHDLWYLVYQSPEPVFVTGSDPGEVGTWGAKQQFMSIPASIVDAGGTALDYWVICDDTDCYLFFSALNGKLYRARTTKGAFPDGFEGTTEVVMEDTDNVYRLFDASNVYKLKGQEKYLLLVSAISGVGQRYFRSWTADRLDGDWTPLADGEDAAFISMGNVSGMEWSMDGPSHGEMLRHLPDETMTIDPCNLQYMYTGVVGADTKTDTAAQNYYAIGLLDAAW